MGGVDRKEYNMYDYNSLQGNALRYMRNTVGKTIEESAKACKHQKSWLSDIEHGRRNILFKDAKSLCHYYGYTLDELANMIDDSIARQSRANNIIEDEKTL